MDELQKKLRRLGISTNKFAEMVGIRTSAMRQIVNGWSTPRPENAKKIEEILNHIRACPACGRAFLEDDDDDGNSKKRGPSRGGR